jgi:selenophosphate synthase
MLTLNRAACEEMLRFDVHGCTDVTGFGLIGHAREMALASQVTLEIAVDQLAVSARRGGVRARQGACPAASRTIANSPPAPWRRCANCRAKSKTCSTIRKPPAAC